VVELAVPSLTRSREPGGKAFQGCLLKPVRKEALYDLLCGVFSPAPDTPEVPPAPPADEILSSRFPLKILVVEDNAINRKVILQILKRLGYSPQIAENGRVCLGRMEAEAFDLVLMDIQMPEMDGYEATAMLRRRGDTTWITALTADAMPDDPMRCRIAGMNDYLSKPIRIETLRAAIERCAIARKELRV
jgi:CheY-like chemotaxis protein